MDAAGLDTDLLEVGEVPKAPDEFAACLNARGLYSTIQFVVRLNPRIHALVDEAVAAADAGERPSGEAIQAYSTYLHETVHWWQHMGSTSGLVLSLARPVLAHINAEHLGSVVQAVGGVKSLRRWAEEQALAGVTISDPALRAANIAVNNAIDAEFYKAITMDPPVTQSCQKDRYFESVGHSYWLAYGQAVSLVAATLDRGFEHLPGGPDWDAGFEAVRAAEIEGFVHGGPVRVAPLGAHALYEGQARMMQLQFLSFGLKSPPTVREFRQAGYFDDIYGQAFDGFLKATSFEAPKFIDDPRVALFLLIVDLAINPTRGFPLEIEDFANFIYDTDPGIRFLRFCQAARDRPELAVAITDYSKTEYEAVSAVLCDACDYDRPLLALQEVASWPSRAPGVAKVMAERESFAFDLPNVVVRVLLSHFIGFSTDKLANPEFFCWPGAWMAGERAGPQPRALFLRHLSLYTDKADDDGIFPRERPGVDPANLITTLNAFYSNIILYDLTRQWIFNDGPFHYNFSWLSQRHSAEDMENWAKSLFAKTYGVPPDTFDIGTPAGR